jgi:hypothetical protein
LILQQIEILVYSWPQFRIHKIREKKSITVAPHFLVAAVDFVGVVLLVLERGHWPGNWAANSNNNTTK